VQDSSESVGGYVFLRHRITFVQRVALNKFGVDNGVSDGTGCFRINLTTAFSLCANCIPFILSFNRTNCIETHPPDAGT